MYSVIFIVAFLALIALALAMPSWMRRLDERHRQACEAEERAARETLSAMGRYIPWSQLEPELRAGNGTVIHQIVRWNGLRIIWWTEDSILNLAPSELPGPREYWEPNDELQAFIEQCAHDYTDMESGTAAMTEFDPETNLEIGEEHIGLTPCVLLFRFRPKPAMCRGHFIAHPTSTEAPSS